jgi:hypothetical protein
MLHSGCKSADKTLTLYDKAYHELLEDFCREVFFSVAPVI